MGIPESQLETWSNQGAVTSAKHTHDSVRNSLSAPSSPLGARDFEAYLQGSYKNDTNIRRDSDVDLVVKLNSTFQKDLSGLSESEKALYKAVYQDATYLWKHFRADVLEALRGHFGASRVSEGNKAIKVSGGGNRLAADVVACLQYRKYESFRSRSDQSYVEGIVFYTIRENRQVINFPKSHYDNGVRKNGQHGTNGWYKPTVRVFKNARTHLVNQGIVSEDLAPSYFLECLLYNVADKAYGQSHQATFLSVIEWLADALGDGRGDGFVCQNGQLKLFGDTPEQWGHEKAVQLLLSLVELWRDW